MTKTASEWITPAQCAAILNVSKMTVYRRIDDGDIKAIRVGRSIRIHHTDLDTYIHNMQVNLHNHELAITDPVDRWLGASTSINPDPQRSYRTDRRARA